METVEMITLPEFPNYRARLEYDDDVEQPYDDGATPILQLQPYGYLHSWPFNKQAEPYGEAARRILEVHDLDVLERYLRIFHGTLKFQTYNVGKSGDYGYAAFDTAAWRADMGITDTERLKDENYLSEVIAWAESDVYGIIIERKVSYTKAFDAEDLEDESGDEWQEVDSCWGFYGSKYAEEAALDMLKASAE